MKIIESRFITLIGVAGPFVCAIETTMGLVFPPYALTDEAVITFAAGRLIFVFRRRSSSATTEKPAERPAAQESEQQPRRRDPSGKKGRPTPKRREAEKHRRRPITAPPKDRKELLRRQRAERRERAARIREGIARGDERYLHKRDRGPVRRMARDFVDARRTVSEFFFMTTFALLLLSLVLQGTQPLLYIILVTNVWPLLLFVFIGDAWIVGYRVRKLARQRFPDEDLRGLGFYAAMRAMQMRWLRLPKPQVRPGEKDKV